MAETAKNRRGGGSVAIAAGNMNILTESETRKGWKRVEGRGAFVNFKALRRTFRIIENRRNLPIDPPPSPLPPFVDSSSFSPKKKKKKERKKK